MKANQIDISQKARYYSMGNGRKLLYVLHGYGQLARFFIQKFKSLADEYTIVAPEGQHYFYLEGTSGRVGASWMTKENRLQDIENHVSFLNTLHKDLNQKKWDEVSVLGFSQGVSTAYRWIVSGEVQPDKFLMCSGMVPPEIDKETQYRVFANTQLTYLTGNDDPYRTEEAVIALQVRLEKSELPIKMIEFEGKHEVNVAEVIKVLTEATSDYNS